MSVAKFETGEGFQSIGERSNPSSGTDFVRATFSHKGRREEPRRLRLVAAFLAAGFEQEPGAALGLVDEDFEQARGAGILMIVAKLVRLAHRGGHVLVVFHHP